MAQSHRRRARVIRDAVDRHFLPGNPLQILHGAESPALAIEDRALYVALHRLEARGYIASEWGVSENNRRARYYQLTPAGKRQLRAETDRWSRYSAAVFRVLQADATGTVA